MSEMKKRILFLIHTLGGGGAEKILVDIANSLDRTKFEVTVMTIIDTGVYRESLSSDISYRSMITLPFSRRERSGEPKSGSGSLMGNGGLTRSMLAHCYQLACRWIPASLPCRLFKNDHYDIEVAFLEGISAKLVASSSSPRKLAWIHTDLTANTKSSRFFRTRDEEECAYASFDGIACVSQEVRDAFALSFPMIPQSKTRVVRNPVIPDDVMRKSMVACVLHEYPQVPAREVGRNQSRVMRLCTIGRLSRVKGIDRLVRVLSDLAEEGFAFSSVIVGDGPERDSIQELVDRYKLGSQVRLLGYRENPYPFLAAADLYLCPSRVEGFSTTVTEACVLGVPVLTTDCPGMKEQLGDSEYGLIVENSEYGLREGLKSLFANALEYEALKNRAMGKRRELLEQGGSLAEIEGFLLGE